MIPFRASARGSIWPVMTVLLIALNVLSFLFETTLAPWELDAWIKVWGVVPVRELTAIATAPARFELWLLPLFTSMFLHGGWAHLLGNMLYLWVFGSTIESRIGLGRFTLLYFAGGLIASQAQVMSAPLSGVPMVGASGAIAAILGAYLVSFPRSTVTVLVPLGFWPLFFNVPAVLFLGFWFLEQLWAGTIRSLSPVAGLAGGVAWWAHAGGFIAGALLIRFLRSEPPTPRREDPRWIYLER